MKHLLRAFVPFSLLTACSELPPAAPSHNVVVVRATEPLPQPSLTELPPLRSNADQALLRFQISAEFGSRMSQAAIRFSFRNVSGDTLLVQRNFSLARKSESRASVWLDVTRVSDGSPPKRICASSACNAGPPTPPTIDDYIELDPDEEFSTRRQLGCTFALPDAGPWRVTAHYRDLSSGPPPQRDNRGRVWFSGPLDSNVLELSVPTIEAVQEALDRESP